MGSDLLHHDEAAARAEAIGDVSYDIAIDLVAGAKEYSGTTTVRFAGDAETFLEFIGGAIESMSINGTEVDPDWDGARITLPEDALRDRNEVTISYRKPYDHSGEGFHQFFDPSDGAEYLYTQFEPYGAHRLFPCFDQPDLKATYRLTVTAPSEWEIISAAQVTSTEAADEGRTTTQFAETLPFSTYLFSLITGPFFRVDDEHNGLPMAMYCRESMAEHMDADEMFRVTKLGMEFFGEFFGRQYPFTKYDQVFVPEFNWGGMENVAAVTYTDTLIFRDKPTRDQLVRRAEILLHELAHMWFGNLVTMRWWNDLWLNESFATFVAYLAMDDSGDWAEVWQDFNTRNKLTAYRDDQQPTTHPIVAEVHTTDEVFLNFDMITYGKGASTLRQLVATIGLDAFSRGLKTYFKRYEFSNTTLADFLGALQEGSGHDLARWAAMWLSTANVNTMAADWDVEDGVLRSLVVSQSAPLDHPVLRPHTMEVGLVRDRDGSFVVEGVPLTIDDAAERVSGVVGSPAPVAVFPNYNDLTYTKVALDPVSLEFVKGSLREIDDALLRHQIWQSLWEMVRSQQLSSLDYLDMMESHLVPEPSDQIIRMVLLTSGATLARYVPESAMLERSTAFVAMCHRAMEASPPGDLKVLWVRSLIAEARTNDDLDLAARLVDDPPDGLAIDQDMRWRLAIRQQAFGIEGAEDRVKAEGERDPTDRGERATLAAHVATPDAAIKAEAWDKLHGRQYESLAKMRSATSGFQWAHQADLLTPYADQFFSKINEVLSSWEWEDAKAYYYGMYPGYRIDTDTLERTKVLAKSADARLRRLGMESVADMERAMACRDLAASQLPAPESAADTMPAQ